MCKGSQRQLFRNKDKQGFKNRMWNICHQVLKEKSRILSEGVWRLMAHGRIDFLKHEYLQYLTCPF